MNLINNNVYKNIQPSGNKHVQGWQSYSPCFQALVEQTKPKTIIEVGSWLGASAINMAKITKQLNLDTKIYCVDTWLGAPEFWTWGNNTPDRDLKIKNGYPQVYFDFLANVVEHNVQDVIIPIPNTSYIGYMILKHYNISADLIYIDGSHEYVDVKNDIVCYLELLNSNGIMFGDDYASWPGVNKAVNETLTNKFQVVENNFWIYKN
jgi:predicted O-methyltransferase YrrM